MSLQVWLPLNGDLKNLGLYDLGTITNNNATINANGKIGSCYEFVGTNSSSLVKTGCTCIQSVTAWSVACWFYRTTTDSRLYLVSMNGTTASNFRFTLNCYNNHLCVRIASTDYNTSPTLAVDLWYHGCFTYDNGNLKIYLNGELLKEWTSTATPSTTTGLNIGMRGGGAGYFSGRLNDVRIYDHCLSQKEVEELAKGLVLHYKLDGNGDIIIPSEYLQLEYIESNGSSWLNTGYIFNPETDGFKVVFKGNDTSNNGMIFASSGNKYSWLYYYSAGMRIYVTNSSGSQLSVAGPTRDTNLHTAIYYNKHYYLDGVDRGALSGSYVSDTNPIYLFAYSGSGTNYAFKGRIYSVEISRNNITLKIFIPSKRLNDNAIGMYEIYSLTFIPSMTSTVFTAGPTISANNIVYDSSGYNNNGILNTSITINSNTARYSRSSYFGNYNEPNIILLDTNILPALNNCTVCWWGKYDTTKTLLLTGQNTSTYLAASNANTFYHAAAGSPVMYKNGVLGTYSCTAGTWDFYVLKNVNLSSWTAMKINSYGSGWPLKGYISDFRIYATTLTDDLIKELYNTSVTIDNKGNIYSREYIEDDDNLNITKTGLFLSSIIHDDNDLTLASILKTLKKILGNTLYEY